MIQEGWVSVLALFAIGSLLLSLLLGVLALRVLWARPQPQIQVQARRRHRATPQVVRHPQETQVQEPVTRSYTLRRVLP
jgi:hypothetical protein